MFWDSDIELEDEWQRGKEVGGHAIHNDEHDFRQMSPEVSVPFRRQLMLTFIEGFHQNDCFPHKSRRAKMCPSGSASA